MLMLFRNCKKKMDKINSEFFNSSILDFDSLNFGFQQKLFVNIPDRTKVKGEFKF